MSRFSVSLWCFGYGQRPRHCNHTGSPAPKGWLGRCSGGLASQEESRASGSHRPAGSSLPPHHGSGPACPLLTWSGALPSPRLPHPSSQETRAAFLREPPAPGKETRVTLSSAFSELTATVFSPLGLQDVETAFLTLAPVFNLHLSGFYNVHK